MFVDVLLSYIQVVKKRLMKALKYKGRDWEMFPFPIFFI